MSAQIAPVLMGSAAVHVLIGFISYEWLPMTKNEERPSAKREDAISNTERDIQQNRACSGVNKKYEGQTVEFRSRDSIAVGQAVLPSELCCRWMEYRGIKHLQICTPAPKNAKEGRH